MKRIDREKSTFSYDDSRSNLSYLFIVLGRCAAKRKKKRKTTQNFFSDHFPKNTKIDKDDKMMKRKKNEKIEIET